MSDTAKVTGPPTVDPPRTLDVAKETTAIIDKEMTLLEEACYRVIYLVTGRNEGAEAPKDTEFPPDGVIPAFLMTQKLIRGRICCLLSSMNTLLEDLN